VLNAARKPGFLRSVRQHGVLVLGGSCSPLAVFFEPAGLGRHESTDPLLCRRPPLVVAEKKGGSSLPCRKFFTQRNVFPTAIPLSCILRSDAFHSVAEGTGGMPPVKRVSEIVLFTGGFSEGDSGWFCMYRQPLSVALGLQDLIVDVASLPLGQHFCPFPNAASPGMNVVVGVLPLAHAAASVLPSNLCVRGKAPLFLFFLLSTVFGGSLQFLLSGSRALLPVLIR